MLSVNRIGCVSKSRDVDIPRQLIRLPDREHLWEIRRVAGTCRATLGRFNFRPTLRPLQSTSPLTHPIFFLGTHALPRANLEEWSAIREDSRGAWLWQMVRIVERHLEIQLTSNVDGNAGR